MVCVSLTVMWDCCVPYAGVARTWAWQLPVHRPPFVASVAGGARPSQLIDLVPSPAPGNDIGATPKCIFCDNPGGTIEYVWPEWLCRYLTEWSDGWNRERGFDVGVIERCGKRSASVSTAYATRAVAAGCSVSTRRSAPFLKSMIAGEPNSPFARAPEAAGPMGGEDRGRHGAGLRQPDTHAAFRL